MSENSAIEWTHHTFNPWWGCTKVGPGCDHCYAETLDKRTGGSHWGPHAERRRTSAKNWNDPIRWNKRALLAGVRERVFCASMADWADNQVPNEWRRDLAPVIEATTALDWLMLTKRPGNAGDMLSDMYPNGVPSNLWLGMTVVNQTEADRDADKLKAAKARHNISVAFLSIEPMLGPIDPSAYAGWIDWVIVGGESGHGSRPMHPDWVRQVRYWCAANGVAFFFKQWGDWTPSTGTNGFDAGCKITDGNSWLSHHWGGESYSIRVGKKSAGKLLDGQIHQNWPEARSAIRKATEG